jgi:23S rRNA pseudouridine1911/1915/1917 synthase
MEPAESDLFIVTEEEAGERLDKLLAKRFQEHYSRTYFQYLIDEQLILLNGQPVKKRAKPQVGDEIDIQFVATPEIDLTPEAIPLSIIYEDDSFIVINKPPGMVVHPAPGNWSATFVHALLFHCRSLEREPASLRPGIVHRLDKDTSGLLVAAKTLEMQHQLTALFASRRVYKEYLAICIGRPMDGEIRAPIGRHPTHRKQMAVVPTGRQAVTICRTIRSSGALSLVQAVILTGRTHQIRLHLRHQGTPILGDPLYGFSSVNDRYGITRQFLHAVRLRFQHPLTGEPLEFNAPLPEDMLTFIHQYFNFDPYLINLSQ